jgi:hypothetical protein
MLKGTRKAAVPLLALALAGFGAAGCGSGSDEKTPTAKPPAISAATASQLASLSEQVATDLDSGDTCDAAQAADELQNAVDASDLSAELRPGVEEVASRLVNEVNCPPPPAPTTTDEDLRKQREDALKELRDQLKQQQEDQKHQGDEHQPPGHGGVEPPGHTKHSGDEG